MAPLEVLMVSGPSYEQCSYFPCFSTPSMQLAVSFPSFCCCSWLQLSHRPLPVPIEAETNERPQVGTGEYTTGFVGGGASTSDKKVGVVGLTLFDLRRRGKVGKLGMVGVSGDKFPAIRM
jgi:hypothetical protein